MAYTLTAKEYEEYRRLKAGINDWISEAEAMQITGWGKRYLDEVRLKGKLKCRSINGRKIQYSRSQLESLFTVVN